ncbi:hypothetical protein [Pedobacter nutrimenti]|jgi:hypothetical protein|uniref:Lipocalin-like protein n=1 Tax=Pedobacter nutrimenti TaxID=1241337 RepID=A0A318UMG7_9SPHI|nr:hypothetical protein [Pedobacter nutrimenti]PYF77183.1 hypothetical protein B0O44_101663 [Pedobacter nutrimenti]
MKTYLSLFLFAIIISFSSCSKSLINDKLSGNWELRHIKGIQVAHVSPDFAPGNGNLIKFTGKTFEKYNDGKLSSKGTYAVQEEKKEINNEQVSYSIVYNNDMGTKEFFNLENGKLTLYVGEIAADGYQSTYQKL